MICPKKKPIQNINFTKGHHLQGGFKAIIQLGIVEARNLEDPVHSTHLSVNPYCLVRIGRQIYHKTDAIPIDTSPRWDSTLSLPIDNHDIENAQILIEIYSEKSNFFFDMFSDEGENAGQFKDEEFHDNGDIALGIIEIPLHFICNNDRPVLDHWWRIKGSQSGELRISTFYIENPETPPGGCSNACEWILKNIDSMYDFYGFKIPKHCVSEWYHLHSYILLREETQIKRWQDFMKIHGLIDFHNQDLYSDLQQLVWDGIPRYLRENIYMQLSGASMKKFSESSTYYQNLVLQTTTTTTESYKQIELDIGRTFGYANTKINTDEGRNSLRRVLKAYSIRNKNIGYCQGLNFIVGILLLCFEEENVFWLLVAICEDLFPGYYTPSMTDTQIDMLVLRDLIAETLPELSTHTDTVGIPLELLGAQWLVCLFTTSFPSETVFRIFDCMFLEGPTFIFSIIIAHLREQQDSILKYCNFQDLIKYLKKIEMELFDADILIQASLNELRSISGQHIESLRQHHRERVIEEHRRVQILQSQLAIAQKIPAFSNYAVQLLRFIHREADLASSSNVASIVHLVCYGIVWLAQYHGRSHS